MRFIKWEVRLRKFYFFKGKARLTVLIGGLWWSVILIHWINFIIAGYTTLDSPILSSNPPISVHYFWKSPRRPHFLLCFSFSLYLHSPLWSLQRQWDQFHEPDIVVLFIFTSINQATTSITLPTMVRFYNLFDTNNQPAIKKPFRKPKMHALRTTLCLQLLDNQTQHQPCTIVITKS